MRVHRTEAILSGSDASGDGRLLIDGLPFDCGEHVDVIIISSRQTAEEETALHGSVRRYDDPFEPTAPLNEWEAA